MDPDSAWTIIEEQRRSLADLLEGLSETQWETPSLCAGWRVRDVAGHVALAPQLTSLSRAAVELVRARGDYDRMVHDVSVRHARRPGADLVAELRDHAASRDLVVLTDHRNILFDILVHGQDIALPLGLERPVPVGAARASLDRVWDMGWPFRARRRLRGLRLAATDTAWSRGEGPLVEGPAWALLMLLTGRTAALDRLGGPGTRALTERVR
ncbi:maleylpyruvate isomerase family mycothiol-dependent enzyme [Nocardiopsis aegyptia]|uniref:Uncharacterized protein (TIGR03083 family) n=1 Tax=Nocardiopsis aegyptia TaxID=220378 RepID=A0A7Z0JAU8_9ACTN|nr:maleylpyruvate isomerase family mycothiol-dependent enzyme [Nocardiopsis aegyptia]NYJ35162.1 uncharacterized protein (TIGR03083 family) [Nocardiopsis aegyptia]